MEWFWIVVGLAFVAFLMAGLCACCCITFRDQFSRSSGTDLGADWVEEAGAWEIVADANNFARTASSNAVLVLDREITAPDYAVEVGVRSIGLADSLRIYIREDASNYFCAEFSRGLTTADKWIKIIKAVGGVETVLRHVYISTAFGPVDNVRVCVYAGAGMIATQVLAPAPGEPPEPGAPYRHSAAVYEAPAGTEIAIGTGSGIAANVDIDDVFVWGRSASCAACSNCCNTVSSAQIDELPPKEIQLEVSGMATTLCDCSTLDGTYILEFEGNAEVADGTLFNLGGCYYRTTFDEAACGAVRVDFYHNLGGVNGNRRYMASITNSAALPATTGHKAAMFRSAGTMGTGTGTKADFCALHELTPFELAEFDPAASSYLCSATVFAGTITVDTL